MGRLKTTEEFKSEMISIHNENYDYEKVVYLNANKKVIVTCKMHGDFSITPDAHRSGRGCAECKYVKVGNANRGNLKESLDDCIRVHGDNYDYSLVTEYSHDREKINVICKIHDTFLVSWNNHKKGRGCPKCQSHGYNKGKSGTFYILVSDDLLKVGITNREVRFRVKAISKDSGHDFKIHTTLFSEDGTFAANIEFQVLKYLRSKYQSSMEVFDGSTECFLNVDIEDLLAFVSPLNFE